MSDTQDPLVVLQHRMQQREILAMMGINQWVQPSSETTNVADISAPTANQSDSSIKSTARLGVEQLSTEISDVESIDPTSGMADDDSTNNYDDHGTNLSQPNEQSPVTYSFDSVTPDTHIVPSTRDSEDGLYAKSPQAVEPAIVPLIQTATAPIKQTPIADINNDHSFKKVAPFNLQGGRYGNWVILVDIQALNHDSQKLWQNITQALSITCETTTFPICEGMDTAELANASLAGYVFKIGRSEEIQGMALTGLPDGVEHPNLVMAPTLDEMLTDSSLKRQLWERLSS